MILATHGIIASQLAGFDADAQAFFDRVTTAGGSLSATEKTAVNQLVLDMKSYSIWSKMKAIYPMVGASAAACAQNLKSSSFTGTFTSGWTFASTGATPNGTSAYMDTNFTPSAELNTTNLVHLSYYSRTNSAIAFEYVMGSIATGTGLIGMYIRRDNNGRIFVADFPSGTSFRVANDLNSTNGQGFYIGTQQGANAKLFRNNSLACSNTTVANNTAITTLPIVIGALEFQGTKQNFTNKQCAFASIGDGLNDTEAGNFYTAVQAFQTTLSRNV